MDFIATLVNREGGDPTDQSEVAWLFIHPAGQLPNEFAKFELTLTVRQPSGRIEDLPRQEGDPHPDDDDYKWPDLGYVSLDPAYRAEHPIASNADKDRIVAESIAFIGQGVRSALDDDDVDPEWPIPGS